MLLSVSFETQNYKNAVAKNPSIPVKTIDLKEEYKVDSKQKKNNKIGKANKNSA